MRSLRDIRLSRLSLAIVVAVSGLATVVILSGASQRTAAERAALVALRQPTTTTRTVAPAAAARAPRSSPATGGGGSGGGSAAGSATSSSAAAATDTSSGAGTSDSGDSGGSGGSGSGGSTTTTTTSASDLPKVGHVFEIALSTTSYQAAFGRGRAPFLDSLERKGTLLRGYRSLGSSELADNLAMISGQVPNADTRGGCTTYAEFPTAVVAKSNGLVPGNGCVYPETALTLGDQVSSSGHVWKAYIEDMGKQTCAHANSNAVDDVALPGAGPGYDSRHNPFIYFHSLLDLGDCATDDLDLSKLPGALASTSKTATFSYLAPNACDDARATAAADDPTSTTSTTSTTSATSTATTTTTTPATTASTTTTSTTSATASPTLVSGALGTPLAAACPGGAIGIAAENAFLKTWVPRILRSPAYKKNGVLVIAFSGDGLKRSGSPVATGALVLSHYADRGKTITKAFSPYSLLRSLEDMLRYTPLARAKSAPSFASAALVKTK